MIKHEDKSHLCEAVDNPPSWCGVKKKHRHTHNVVQQP